MQVTNHKTLTTITNKAQPNHKITDFSINDRSGLTGFTGRVSRGNTGLGKGIIQTILPVE
jgi:hypothetical protein